MKIIRIKSCIKCPHYNRSNPIKFSNWSCELQERDFYIDDYNIDRNCPLEDDNNNKYQYGSGDDNNVIY